MTPKQLFKTLNKQYDKSLHYSRKPYGYLKYGIHYFEIRHWIYNKQSYSISISAVNWTMNAGPCSIKLTSDNINLFSYHQDR